MITVVENFLDEQDAITVEQMLLSPDFPWYLDPYTAKSYSSVPTLNDIMDSPQFAHGFIRDGDVLLGPAKFIPSLLTLKFSDLCPNPNRTVDRVKANLNPQYAQMSYAHYPPHTDIGLDIGQGISAIYYVSDSDGDTLFFAGDGVTSLDLIRRVTPKRNTLVYFDSTVIHAGSPPKESFKRCVINMVFKENLPNKESE